MSALLSNNIVFNARTIFKIVLSLCNRFLLKQNKNKLNSTLSYTDVCFYDLSASFSLLMSYESLKVKFEYLFSLKKVFSIY